VEQDPLSAFAHWRLGLRYYCRRQWDAAIKEYRNALEFDPNYTWALAGIPTIYIGAGKLKEAIQFVGPPKPSASPVSIGLLGYFFGLVGQRAVAQKYLQDLKRIDPKIYTPPSAFAHIYLGLGDMEKCFDWLEKAVDENDGFVFLLHVLPYFDPIRSHARYPALLRKMNLQP